MSLNLSLKYSRQYTLAQAYAASSPPWCHRSSSHWWLQRYPKFHEFLFLFFCFCCVIFFFLMFFCWFVLALFCFFCFVFDFNLLFYLNIDKDPKYEEQKETTNMMLCSFPQAKARWQLYEQDPYFYNKLKGPNFEDSEELPPALKPPPVDNLWVVYGLYLSPHTTPHNIHNQPHPPSPHNTQQVSTYQRRYPIITRNWARRTWPWIQRPTNSR